MTSHLLPQLRHARIAILFCLMGTPAAAQMSFDLSAYADGAYDDEGYNGNGDTELYYWGSGDDDSNPGGAGCSHSYGFYLEVTRQPGQEIVAQVYGADGADGTTWVSPATYNIDVIFAIWCSCFQNWVAQTTAQRVVQVEPPIPTGENTTPNGWLTGGVHKFVQVLLPNAISFYGREVREFVGGQGVDSCWFSGSMIDPQTTVSGGTWSVGSSNVWGQDNVGWEESGIVYYRQQQRAPCGAILIQGMMINIPGGYREYVVHALEGSFTSSTVTSVRAEESVTHTWP
jgi:hypothetical protein